MTECQDFYCKKRSERDRGVRVGYDIPWMDVYWQWGEEVNDRGLAWYSVIDRGGVEAYAADRCAFATG